MADFSNKHLFVLQHGLWGSPEDLKYLNNLLQTELKDRNVVILNVDINSRFLTYDGVDVCGDRLVSLLHEYIAALAKENEIVKEISFIGYSLGGLVIRYVVGKLYSQGFFTRIKPVNFVTIATPHLGSWRMPENFLNATFNAMVTIIASRAGYQLVLQDDYADGRPLLEILADPKLPFFQALTLFSKLMLFANIFNDRSVPYCTAAICEENPYESHLPVPICDKYPSIVSPQSQIQSMITRARELKGAWRKAVFIVAMPIAGLPVLLFMAARGLSHYHSYKNVPKHDNTWLSKFNPALPSIAHESIKLADSVGTGEIPGGKSLEKCDVNEVAYTPEAMAVEDQDSSVEGDGSDGKDCIVTVHDPDDMHVRICGAEDGSSEKHECNTPATATINNVDVELQNKSHLQVHEGLVETAGSIRNIQLSIINNLNSLPWTKFDVDTGYYWAHAAIVNRVPKQFEECRDVLDCLISELSLPSAGN